MPGIQNISYQAPNVFRISGETIVERYQAELTVGRRIKADCGVDGVVYSTVLSTNLASYADLDVTLKDSVLTANLAAVWFGVEKAGPGGTMALHDHSSDEQGGVILPASPLIAGFTTNAQQSMAPTMVLPTWNNVPITNISQGTGISVNTNPTQILFTLPAPRLMHVDAAVHLKRVGGAIGSPVQMGLALWKSVNGGSTWMQVYSCHDFRVLPSVGATDELTLKVSGIFYAQNTELYVLRCMSSAGGWVTFPGALSDYDHANTAYIFLHNVN